MSLENRAENAPDYLLEVQDVKKWFPVDTGFFGNLFSREEPTFVRAVDGVSFNIRRGEVFGLAGESGSGKTTVGRLALRLAELTSGKVFFDGVDLASLSSEELRHQRAKMQVIFQDPMASLNPRMTLGEAIAHPLLIHNPEEKSRKMDHVYEVLDSVGLSPPANFYNKYPHQISGGQRQRIVVARALITKPELILADEPIAMADVSVRALLLDLMNELKDVYNLTYLFITHDLATAKYICDRIGIMYLGKIVEVGPLREVYSNAVHPYTRALLAAVPVPDPHFRRTDPLPRGEIPSPINPPSGCRFHPRCPIAQPICKEEIPQMLPVAGHAEHRAACHLRTGAYQELDPDSPES